MRAGLCQAGVTTSTPLTDSPRPWLRALVKPPIGYVPAARGLLALALVAGHARAEDTPKETTTHEAPSGREPASEAPAPAGERAARAERPASPNTKIAAAADTAAITKAATARATRGEAEANARRASAQADGKDDLATRLTALVEQWKRLALALADASNAEAEASAVEQESLTLEESASRAEALLEQTEARRARALGRMRELGLSPTVPEAAPAKPAGEPAQKAPASTGKASGGTP